MRHSLVSILMVLGALGLAGCVPGVNLGSQNDPSGAAESAAVAAKAVNVANQIGGSGGFGGMAMNGYMQHVEPQMGFMTIGDLAEPGSMMNVMLHNQSVQVCTFHVNYVTSQDGTQEQSQDVTVPAGGQQVVQMPCSEIMGFGSLENPGAVGCHLADGQAIGNLMAVPGFLNMDYACGGTYHMYLTEDTNDLDGDGDTQELVLSSEAMQTHMAAGGPMGHMHPGRGMMP